MPDFFLIEVSSGVIFLGQRPGTCSATKDCYYKSIVQNGIPETCEFFGFPGNSECPRTFTASTLPCTNITYSTRVQNREKNTIIGLRALLTCLSNTCCGRMRLRSWSLRDTAFPFTIQNTPSVPKK